jgi:hypothetical protein
VRAALALLLATGAMASPLPAREQQPPPPTVQPPVPPKETDQDLRKLPPSEPPKPGEPVREVPDLKRTEMPSKRGPAIPEVLAGDLRRLPTLAPWPPSSSARIVQPKGAAAGRYALHFTDGSFAVHEVSGALAAGPFAFESLWRDARDPEACKAASDQSLAIRYDQRAGRWLLSRWARPAPGSAFHLCAALSRTTDPIAGGWYLYDLLLPMYRAGTALEPEAKTYSLAIDLGGTQALFAFDRVRMLAGDPVELTRTLPDRHRPPQ